MPQEINKFGEIQFLFDYENNQNHPATQETANSLCPSDKNDSRR